MKQSTIIVIPAEGDSVATEQWYVNALMEHYASIGRTLRVIVFDYAATRCDDTALNIQVRNFFATHHVENAEIHAQAGFGASIAFRMLAVYSDRISRVFFVGGAPSDAMTGIAKFFHRHLSRLWYRSPIAFFADDPNPTNDPQLDLIRASSTAAMRENPLRYRNQLVHIGTWRIPTDWQVPHNSYAYFVPNGQTVRPKWWDNTFDNAKAAKIWAAHGVASTRQPGGYFSLYNMMPAAELFKVMDEVRIL